MVLHLYEAFINDLDEVIEGVVIKFADNIKVGEIANTLKTRLKIQKNFNRLEHCVLANRMQFSGEKVRSRIKAGKTKCQV